jgi:hypothetical protein
MVLSETRSLQLCWIMRGGIGYTGRLGAEAHKIAYLLSGYSPSIRASHEETRLPPPRMIPKGWTGLLVRDAQAACGFNCLASKCAPFFHRIRVIAAIFRAKVRRAIAGFMPFVSKPW